MSKVSFLGAGSWGTALAIMLAQNGHEVTVWSAVQAEIDMLTEHRSGTDRLCRGISVCEEYSAPGSGSDPRGAKDR